MSAAIKSTHQGTIDLGSGPVACFVLEEGTRVLGTSQVQGVLGAGKDRHLSRSLAAISKGSAALELRPIKFSTIGGEALGYDAKDVVKILAAYQRAFLRGELHAKQIPIAHRAMAAIAAFASIGLRSLIDEATGYQSVRPADDHQTAYSRFFLENMRPWQECFDSDWDKTFCRLYGHPYAGRPPLFLGNLNGLVYQYAFGKEAYESLKAKNPNPRHRSNHHQLTTDDGRIKLSQVINTVRGIAKVSRSPKDFLSKLQTVYNDVPLQLDWC